MKEITFTFAGSEDQILELLDYLRQNGVLGRMITVKKPKTLVIPVWEISIEEADAILKKDY